MVIGPLLGAVGGLASALLQSGSQADQRNLQYLNLYEQKRQAREREALAKATRTDAYGNKIVYIPGQGFITETTPLTKAILDSQQKEQLAQFRDDAPRVRAAAERVDKRARQAGDVYDEMFNKYRYSRRKSEEEYIAEAIRDAIDSRRETKDIGAREMLARSAMRLGNSGAAKNLYAAAKESQPQQTLSQAIAQAKKFGKQQYLSERAAENQNTFGELNNLRSIADAVMTGNMNWNNENAALSSRQDNALSNLIQTNAQGAQAIGNAYNSTASAAGLYPDISGVVNSLSRLNFEGQPQQTEQEKLLADLLMQQRIGSAQLGIYKNNDALSAYKGNVGVF